MTKNIFYKLLKNLLLIIISVVFIITITFFIFEIIPGDVYDLDYIKDETIIYNIRKKYGLDKPMYIRYLNTLKNAFLFDFGNSFINEGRSVREIVASNFPVSAKIGVIAIILSLLNGISLGFCFSKTKYKNRKYFIMSFIILSSLPTFVLAVLLQYFLGVKLSLFPVYGVENFYGYLLPVFILSVTPTIFIARLMDRKIAEISNSDYVVSAQIRGVKEETIKYKYILKNSISPILSYLGPLIANLLVGSFVVESIFNIPGLGRYFITSITNRDYPVVMGLTMFYSVFLIVMTSLLNLLVSIVDYKGDIYGK